MQPWEKLSRGRYKVLCGISVPNSNSAYEAMLSSTAVRRERAAGPTMRTSKECSSLLVNDLETRPKGVVYSDPALVSGVW